MTVEEIRERTAGKRAAYAWSAGKDSLVLGEICEKSEINDCMMAVCDLEYPAFRRWVDRHKPKGLEIINTGQDLEWLSKHPNMLFPQDSATAAKWFSIVQHRAQEKILQRTSVGRYSSRSAPRGRELLRERIKHLYQWKRHHEVQPVGCVEP